MCILLRASSNWKIWNGKCDQCFSLFKEPKLQKPIFIDAASQIAEKVFKFSYSDATEIWPDLCASKDVFNTNEDALTETNLNFRNVQVVLGKEYVLLEQGNSHPSNIFT